MKRLSIASPERTRQLLENLHITPSKSLGQNFLISPGIAEKIDHGAQQKGSGNILEIGPGLGALSELLAQRADSLCLVELDGRLCLHLQRMFAHDDKVEVVSADALCFDYVKYGESKGWQEYQVVGNLPYNITSSIIRRLLLMGGPWQRLTLMTQKEVAEKLSSRNVAEGGPLAVLLNYFGSVRLAFTVPPESFLPPPEIQSAVLQVERHTKPPFPLENPASFEVFLLAAFRHRRKTLINSLQATLGGGRELWQEALKACGIPENYRAEQLGLHEFGTLYHLPQVNDLLS